MPSRPCPDLPPRSDLTPTEPEVVILQLTREQSTMSDSDTDPGSGKGESELRHVEMAPSIKPAGSSQASNTPQVVAERIRFLATEQQAHLQAFVNLEEQKARQYHFLFVLLSGSLVYAAAPYQLWKSVSPEQVFLYALAGLSISLILVFFTNRFLLNLGRAVRRRAYLYRMITTTRAWVMRNHPSYFRFTMAPEGVNYDRSRSWTCSDDPILREAETHPNPVHYNTATPWFFVTIQLLVVLLAIHYVSIMYRIISFYLAKKYDNALEFAAGGSINLSEATYLMKSVAVFSWAIILWIQFIGNECAHYFHVAWECRRMSSARPNPRFIGKAIKQKEPARTIFNWGLPVALIASAIVFFLGLMSDKVEPFIALCAGLGLCLVFGIGKAFFIWWQIHSETIADREAKALSIENS